MNKIGCIYKITNLINGKCYIGKSQDFEKRKTKHILEGSSSKSNYLYRSMKKNGVNNFKFDIIYNFRHGKYSNKCANILEKHYIQKYNSFIPNGYNMTLGGEGQCGSKFSIEHKAKISASNLGKKVSEETRAKLSASKLGKKISAAHKAKLLASNLGRKVSEETRAKLSASNLGRGRKISAETRAKISASNLGKKVSEETRAKISASMSGKKKSAAHKAKLSASKLGNTNGFKKKSINSNIERFLV